MKPHMICVLFAVVCLALLTEARRREKWWLTVTGKSFPFQNGGGENAAGFNGAALATQGNPVNMPMPMHAPYPMMMMMQSGGYGGFGSGMGGFGGGIQRIENYRLNSQGFAFGSNGGYGPRLSSYGRGFYYG